MILRRIHHAARWTLGVDASTPAHPTRATTATARVDTRPGASTPASNGHRWETCSDCGHYARVNDAPDGLRICRGCQQELDRPARHDSAAAAVQTAEGRLAAIQQAITAVDAKATLAATVQTAALAALLTTPTGGGWLLGRASVAALLAALALSGAVVTPRLTRRRHVAHAADAVWFGQLRGWDDPAVLAAHLHHQTRHPGLRLVGLARQLTATSRIAWRKHRLLRASLTATAIAVVLEAAARLTPLG